MIIDILPERLQRKIMPEPMSGCWIWIGAQRDGYGLVNKYIDGQQVGNTAYREVFESVNGKVPEGLELDHTCNPRQCVNPAHLEPVTHIVNMDRAKRRRLERRHCEHCDLHIGTSGIQVGSFTLCMTCGDMEIKKRNYNSLYCPSGHQKSENSVLYWSNGKRNLQCGSCISNR
jgi:hypothetical protein